MSEIMKQIYLAFSFFREIPAALSITGLIIVLAALAMLVLSDKKQEAVEE